MIKFLVCMCIYIYMQGEPVELMQCLFSSVLCVQGKAVGQFGPHLYSHVSIIRAFTAAWMIIEQEHFKTSKL